MTDNITEGRGRRKKKRNGWLEKDEAAARAEEEMEAKRRKQSPTCPDVDKLEEPSLPPSTSLKSPPEFITPPLVGLQITSSFESHDGKLVARETNTDCAFLSGTTPSNNNQIQPPTLPPMGDLHEPSIPPYTSLKSPPECMSPLVVELQKTSSFEYLGGEFVSIQTNNDCMSLSGTTPSNAVKDIISISGISSSKSPPTNLIPLVVTVDTGPSSFLLPAVCTATATTSQRSTVARKDWPDEVKMHPDVMEGYMTLSMDGTRVICHICGNKELLCRHRYSLSPVFTQSGHVSCDSHRKNLGSKKWSDRRDAKMRADGKKVQTKKYLPQSSLFSAFKRQAENCTKRAAVSGARASNSITSASSPMPSSSSKSKETAMKRNVCTGIIPLKLLTTQSDLTKCNIVNVHRYCEIDAKIEYEIRGIDGSDSNLNLFVKSCIGEVVHLVGNKQGGTRCTACMKYWTLNSSRVKKMTKQRNTGIIHAQQCIMKPELTNEDYLGLVNFTRTERKYFNIEGNVLMDQVHHRINYYKEARKIAVLTKTHTSSDIPNNSYVITKNTDSFLHDIITLFVNHPQLKEGLIGALIHVVAMKMKGHQNPRLPSVAMNFFIASQSLSPRAFDFVSANLLGPSRRTILRHNAKERTDSMICIENDELELRLTKHLTQLPVYGSTPMLISLSFDGTKVPENLALSIGSNAIVGGVFPNHQIDINGKTDNEVMELLSDQSNLERAKELKFAVVTIQDPGVGESPYFVLGGQPQGINAVTSFNTRVTDVCLKVCQQLEGVSFISASADGVGCDARFIRKQLILFLSGVLNHVGLVDSNHNCKNFRYQVIGGSCVLVLGNYIIDPQMLVLCGVAKEIWRPTDWASDLLVLKLNSSDTVTKLLRLSDEDVGSTVVLTITLYFTRLKLYAVNAKKANYRDRITFCWAGLLWITSLECHSKYGGKNQSTIATNCRNIMTETIGMIFSMARKGVKSPRYMTTEALEHTFGAFRAERREATVLGFTEIEDKVRRRTKAIHAGSLKVSRDPQKGYSAMFSSFVETVQVPYSVTEGGIVDVLDDECAVEKLFEVVGPIINSVVLKMKPFLTRLGVKSDAMSPFCRCFDSHTALLAVYQANMPYDIDDEPTAVPEENGTPTNEVGIVGTVNIPSLTELVGILQDNATSEENLCDYNELQFDEATAQNNNDHALLSGADEINTTEAAKQLRNLFSASALGDMLESVSRGMALLNLKGRESGSVTKDQKFKSISERWFAKAKERDNADDNVDGLKYIERNTLVRIKLVEGKGINAVTGEEDFRVLTVYTKNGKCWHICNKGKQAWKRGMMKDKFRLLLRMVTFDYSSGHYQDTDVETSKWGKSSIYILIDGYDVIDISGKMILDRE